MSINYCSSTPIRILHIVGMMNRGGLETFLMNVYRNIDRNRVQFDFLITRQKEGFFDNEIRKLGGKIYYIPSMEKVGVFKYNLILLNFFKENNYNIIHCHRNMLSGVYLKQARKAKIPIRICHSHSTKLVEEKNLKGLIKYITKIYFKQFINSNATHFFACGEKAGEWLYGLNLEKEKIQIVKNGVNINHFIYNENFRIQKRKELNISDDILLIGHVGRFDIPKNHNFIVDIIANMKDEFTNYRFAFVGEGILQDSIKNKIKNLDLWNNVLFLGGRSDINELMMAFDILILPSLFEGVPITLIEAQVSGLNIIASDKVPQEVDLGMNLIDFEEINNTCNWIKKILDFNTMNDKDRTINKDKIQKSGYDIKQTVQFLQEFYLKNNGG